MNQATPAARRPKRAVQWRPYWLTVHLWLGLSAGLIFVLLGLTGSALVFYREIDGWLNPQVVIERQAGPEHGYQAILDAIRTAHPQRVRAWRLEVPSTTAANRAYTARYYFAEEKRGQHFAPLMVTVNPYTLAVTDSRLWGDTIMTFIYDLHYELLIDEAGTTVLAVIGIGIVVSLASGLYLWWPRWRSAGRALRYKPHASTERRIYDIHKLSGVYGLVLTAMLAITGVLLEKPEWFKPWLNALSPVFTAPSFSAASVTAADHASDLKPLSADAAVARAQQALPLAIVRWIETPDGPTGVYKLRLQQPGEPSARFPQSMVWLDPYRGTVLAVRDAHQHSASDTLFAWLHPLHNGEAFGLIGRWLVFAAGGVPLALFITGVVRWRQKRRAAHARTGHGQSVAKTTRGAAAPH